MKLLTKTGIYYLLFSAPVLIIAGLVAYYFVTHELKENTDELLLLRSTQITKSLQLNDSKLVNNLNLDDEVEITFFPEAYLPFQKYSDTLRFEPQENELAPYRMLVVNSAAQDGYFQIKLFRSTIEYDNLLYGIFSGLLLVFVFLLASFLSVNYYVSKILWKPFYKTLEKLKSFEFDIANVTPMDMASITEFNDLNNALNEMMAKMNADFINQKQFTENAAHELQTPIAVMQLKVDQLIQSDKLGDEEMELIAVLDSSIKKLKHLNRSLLLLSKIENKQFVTQPVLLNAVIESTLVQLNDFITIKNIQLKTSLHENVILNLHPDLCEILVTNLLQNAIRHNTLNGTITIELNKEHLVVANTGRPLEIDAAIIFNRFEKHSQASESVGLGLAIVKEICQNAGIEIRYVFENDMHRFDLLF